MIARSILPVRHIEDSSHDVVAYGKNQQTWPIFRVASSWREDGPRVRKIAETKIHRLEDDMFINGREPHGIIGMNSTSTVRFDLAHAIEEFKPSAIVTSSKWLKPKGIKVYRTPYADDPYGNYRKFTNYLIPQTISPMDAEFVIARDIYDESKDSSPLNELNEYMVIELHNPNIFVKVMRK